MELNISEELRAKILRGFSCEKCVFALYDGDFHFDCCGDCSDGEENYVGYMVENNLYD